MAGHPFLGFFFGSKSPFNASAGDMPSGSMLSVNSTPSASLSDASKDATLRCASMSLANGPSVAADRNSSTSQAPLPSASRRLQASSFVARRTSPEADPGLAPKISSKRFSASSLSSSPELSASYFSKRIVSCSSNGNCMKLSRLSFSTANMMPNGVNEAWLTQLTGKRTSGLPSSGTIVRTHEALIICPNALMSELSVSGFRFSSFAPIFSSMAFSRSFLSAFIFCTKRSPAASHSPITFSVGLNLQRMGSKANSKPVSFNRMYSSSTASPLQPKEPNTPHGTREDVKAPLRTEADCWLPFCAAFKITPNASFIWMGI
mmetsp:Transcript_42302/g.127842  ORF Transcript_42302/g.127842 Transcript_42302/m.127842 type:complete len:319 (+) Transcript_42302:168-1124(+)